MSATWTKILTAMIDRGAADRGTIDAALGRRLLTADEHDALVAHLEGDDVDDQGEQQASDGPASADGVS